MSDFGFAEAERKAKERLQKDVERLTAKRDASLMKQANENKALRE